MLKKLLYNNSRVTLFIIIFSNSLSFMLMQTVFFWFIISEGMIELIKNKSVLIRDLAKTIPDVDNNIKEYFNSSDFIEVINKANEDKNKRDKHNLQVMWNWLTIPFSVVVGMLSGCILLEIILIIKKINKEDRFSKMDIYILITVLCAFISEIIFYFTVISRSILLTDTEVIEYFISSEYFDYDKYGVIFNT